MGVSASLPNIASLIVFIPFISGVVGDGFDDDDDMIVTRNIFMAIFAMVAFVFLLTFIVILCKVCMGFRRADGCHHTDYCTPTPVVVTLPPQNPGLNTVAGGYPKPPPYSPPLPSAPPPYGFNPEINAQSDKSNYF
uniref:Uncharacterized protein n=1 Tax=Graphocephala atropunctata TaxID=36148 RepID=A0A1B6LEW8_9HEMI